MEVNIVADTVNSARSHLVPDATARAHGGGNCPEAAHSNDPAIGVIRHQMVAERRPISTQPTPSANGTAEANTQPPRVRGEDNAMHDVKDDSVHDQDMAAASVTDGDGAASRQADSESARNSNSMVHRSRLAQIRDSRQANQGGKVSEQGVTCRTASASNTFSDAEHSPSLALSTDTRVSGATNAAPTDNVTSSVSAQSQRVQPPSSHRPSNNHGRHDRVNAPRIAGGVRHSVEVAKKKSRPYRDRACADAIPCVAAIAAKQITVSVRVTRTELRTMKVWQSPHGAANELLRVHAHIADLNTAKALPADNPTSKVARAIVHATHGYISRPRMDVLSRLQKEPFAADSTDVECIVTMIYPNAATAEAAYAALSMMRQPNTIARLPTQVKVVCGEVSGFPRLWSLDYIMQFMSHNTRHCKDLINAIAIQRDCNSSAIPYASCRFAMLAEATDAIVNMPTEVPDCEPLQLVWKEKTMPDETLCTKCYCLGHVAHACINIVVCNACGNDGHRAGAQQCSGIAADTDCAICKRAPDKRSDQATHSTRKCAHLRYRLTVLPSRRQQQSTTPRIQAGSAPTNATYASVAGMLSPAVVAAPAAATVHNDIAAILAQHALAIKQLTDRIDAQAREFCLMLALMQQKQTDAIDRLFAQQQAFIIGLGGHSVGGGSDTASTSAQSDISSVNSTMTSSSPLLTPVTATTPVTSMAAVITVTPVTTVSPVILPSRSPLPTSVATVSSADRPIHATTVAQPIGGKLIPLAAPASVVPSTSRVAASAGTPPVAVSTPPATALVRSAAATLPATASAAPHNSTVDQEGYATPMSKSKLRKKRNEAAGIPPVQITSDRRAAAEGGRSPPAKRHATSIRADITTDTAPPAKVVNTARRRVPKSPLTAGDTVMTTGQHTPRSSHTPRTPHTARTPTHQANMYMALTDNE
jgi:hypothetical protein